MKTYQIRPLHDWCFALFKGATRSTVGGVTTGIVFLIVISVVGCSRTTAPPEKPAGTGPRVPISTVPAETINAGRGAYLREGCDNCHTLRDSYFWSGGVAGGSNGSIPDLSHEGRRHASIAWQVKNLRYHSRVFPDGWMPNYDNLTPQDLQAIASYLATRR